MSEIIKLRYFDARGRAQFLRYYLRVRNIEFIDERIPIEPDFASWMAIRGDGAVTGPFHKLPVLEIDGFLLAETSVIAGYLHERLGDSVALDEHTDLRHRQLISALDTDVTLALGMLLWAEVMYAGLDFAACTKRAFERLTQNLGAIEAALVGWRWLEQANIRPLMLADCRLWECIDVCHTVFGEHLKLDALPTLKTIHQRYRSGTAFSELLTESPCPITARPNEPEVIARIRSILAA